MIRECIGYAEEALRAKGKLNSFGKEGHSDERTGFQLVLYRHGNAG